MKRGLALLAWLGLTVGGGAKTFRPQISWPAAIPMEEAESRFRIVNAYMPRLIGWLLDSQEAKTKNAVAGIPVARLLWLRESLQPEVSALVFVSARASGENFVIDGQVRIAKTGSRAHSEIRINRDLIVSPDDITGQEIPLPFATIGAVMVHEYAHHLDETGFHYEHIQLDALGAALRGLFETRSRKIDFGREPPFIVDSLPESLTFYGFSSFVAIASYEDALFLVRDSEKIWDVTSLWVPTQIRGEGADIPTGCQEFGPSAEDLNLRDLQKTAGVADFVFAAMRLFFCSDWNQDAATARFADYHFRFLEKAEGRWHFDSIDY